MPSHLRPAILAGLLWLSGAAAALAQVAGDYLAYGRNPDGSAYSGTVQVVQSSDGSYTVTWQVGTVYSGHGVLQGQVLVIDWGDTTPAYYVLMPDGELHGTWADGEGLELWTRTPR